MNISSILIGVSIAAIGLIGVVAPTDLGTIAQNATNPIGIYVVAALRLWIGYLLIGAARTARMPNVIRVFGILAVLAALATPILGFPRAEALVNWWVEQGVGVVRMTGAVAMALGTLIVAAA